MEELEVDRVLRGDALEVLRALPDACVDCVLTDPPYFRVKGEAWDRQWDKPQAFLAWMGALADEWRRVLKPNGSLYVFTSPQMAARVECVIAERLRVLNHIVWRKADDNGARRHAAQVIERGVARSYYPGNERIIFAEQYGADSMALGESGYAAQCETLHGHVFESLRAYLDGERRRAGIDKADCNAACGFARIPGGMASRHYFSRSQWMLPTQTHYAALRRLFNERGRKPAPPFADFHPAGSPFAKLHEMPRQSHVAEYLRADYEYLRADYEYLRADYEYLRADYEELRADYEELRRPFSVTADVPYTDVWDFAPVQARPGKHACEKPLPLLRHMVRASTRPGDLILDCFAGSGSTGEAARLEGRRFLGVERDELWAQRARRRVEAVAAGALPEPAVAKRPARRAVVANRQPRSQPTLWDTAGHEEAA